MKTPKHMKLELFLNTGLTHKTHCVGVFNNRFFSTLNQSSDAGVTAGSEFSLLFDRPTSSKIKCI